MKNRLNLDFSIESSQDRANFLNTYLLQEEFLKKPPTDSELETCANYVLWGKNQNGLNVKQEKLIQLESRNKTWDNSKEESLEALIETPGFQETVFLKDRPPTRIKKQIFSREEARAESSPLVLEAFESLWKEIDKTDLIINFYEQNIGKRDKPPRENLLNKFSEEERLKFLTRAQKLSQFQYLKLKHLLVELRREQFTLRDTYKSTILTNPIVHYNEPSKILFDENITILPFGLKTNKTLLNKKIFSEDLNPEDFSEEELQQISSLIWKKKTDLKFFFDFRELDHVYQMFLLFDNLEDSSLQSDIESTLPEFIETIKFYMEMAHLSDLHKEILDLKIRQFKNQEIADIVNPKYNKTYNANYISTIFKQKIIVSINEAAKQHFEVLQNIFFPENFKKCSKCGKLLLLNNENFVRRAKSKDGFSARCKRCDKLERQRAKEKK